ncbi:MAG: cytochrome b562 [Bacteriovorax sp.]|nr:cytochrome b562 [Bacteriovorax sp.]
MKKFSMVLIFALTLPLSLVSQLSAQDVSPLNLQNNMRQTGIILKQVSASINDASKNQENAASVAKMIAYFQTARTQSPDSVTNGSFADYQALIDQEIQNFKDLQDAFLKNDNVAALSIVHKLNTVKKEGHDKYK